MKKLMIGLLLLLTHNMAWASINHLVECSTCYSEEAFIIKAKLSYTGNGDAQEIYLFNPVTKTTKAYLISSSGNPGRSFSPGLHVEPETLTASQQQDFDELVGAYTILKGRLLAGDTTVVIDEQGISLPGIDPIGDIWGIVNHPTYRTLLIQTLFNEHTNMVEQYMARLHGFEGSVGLGSRTGLTVNVEVPERAWIIHYVLPDGSSLDVAFPPNQFPQIVAMADSEGRPLFFPDQLGNFIRLQFDVENQGWNNYNEWRSFLEFAGFHFIEENNTPAACVVIRVDIGCQYITDPETGNAQRVCPVKYTYECP